MGKSNKFFKMKFTLFVAAAAARHHHHHHHEQLIATHADDMAELNSMSESKLVSSLQSTLDMALAAEARDDKAAAVAKTAAIKNTQKALTARILKRLDDGQPLVEVARKMRPSRACSPRSTIWREDSVSCNPSSPFSRTPSRPSKRSLMFVAWARNETARD